MIFVTVGGTSNDFSRLVKKMDEISRNTEEEVIMQIGETEYKPEHSKYFKFVSKKEIQRHYKEARIIVGHAGMGTIISAYKYDTPIIIVPRREKYDEHFDDHQMEIAKRLEKEGIGKVIYNVGNLKNAIKSAEDKSIREVSDKNQLVMNLRNYLSSLEHE